MIHHHLCDPSAHIPINDVSSTAASVPDINNNELVFQDRTERVDIGSQGGEEAYRNQKLILESDCHSKGGNETGSTPPSSFDEEWSIQDPLSCCIETQVISPSNSSKELFTYSKDYANQNHKCCSTSINCTPSSISTSSVVRFDEVNDFPSPSSREAQPTYSYASSAPNNQSEPEMMIEFDEIRDDIELIVDIYLFIEKSSWALKTLLW